MSTFTSVERIIRKFDRRDDPRDARDPTGRRGLDRARFYKKVGEWLTTQEAVPYLGLPSRKALYQAVRRGQVPVHRLGLRRMRFLRRELDEVIRD